MASESRSTSQGHAQAGVWSLALGALGVVFGDIGTSPLYALRECFAPGHRLELSEQNILGVLSLIFWTITLIVSIKYMHYVLKADNKGEGGILSLMALAVRAHEQGQETRRRRWILTTLGLIGAALLYGDGIITPAISVLSAVEGIKIATEVFDPYVVPVTIVIINALFVFQRFGTARIARVFGPVILVWFTTIGGLGLNAILQRPGVLAALSPHFALEFLVLNPSAGLLALGAVVLVVTGGEALYADMGHFGRRPMRIAWFAVAMPGLLLNYFGQGALLLQRPEAIENPFYLLAPEWALIPLVVLSTSAAVIASQALISGVFSLTRQAILLGFWPRVSIIHTSSREIGQIYVPSMNWALFAGVIWLVLTFKNSSSLAAAYGVAVTLTMLMTTLLAYEVARRKWAWGKSKALIIFGAILVIDGFFAWSTLLKVSHGGWVPLVVGAAMYTLMTTWQTGRKVLYRRLKERSVSIEDFCQMLLRNPPLRVSGTAVYMSGDPWGVPVPLLHNLRHNKVLHERIALLTIHTKEVPFVPKEDRVEIQEIIPNLYRIVAHYGFMEIPKMKHILEACRNQDIHFVVPETTFVLGRETILPSSLPAMPLWREKIFALMSKNAQRPTAFFKIPPNQVIEVGIQVEI